MAGDLSTNELATRQPNTPAQTHNSRQDNSAVFGMPSDYHLTLYSSCRRGYVYKASNSTKTTDWPTAPLIHTQGDAAA